MTAENKLLAEFPESYAGEKVNIRVQTAPLTEGRVQTDLPDFIFANEAMQIADRYDSIYAYTDEAEVVWTVWRNNKPIKNRAQRVLVANAYNTFEAYVHAQVDTRRSHGWIWFVLAGLILLGALLYGGYIALQRRKEKSRRLFAASGWV